MKSRVVLIFIIIIFGSLSPAQLSAQCEQRITIEFTSINFLAGCDFGDSGGLDPVLEVYDPISGNRLYISHYGDLSQVTGPMNEVPIDFSQSWNPCGNNSKEFLLGTYPIETTDVTVDAEVYEKDSNFFNSECGGYNVLFDTNHEEGSYSFDLTQSMGTLEIGGLMSYNYILTKEVSGTFELSINETICAKDTFEIAGTQFYSGKASEDIFIKGATNTCDTLFRVNIDFYSTPSLSIVGPDIICLGESITLKASTGFENYTWNEGTNADSLKVTQGGTYVVHAISRDGCIVSDSVMVELSSLQPAEITGAQFFCSGSSSDLEVNILSTETVQWSNGNTTNTLTAASPGDYSVTLTDIYGCTSSDTILVDEFQNPTPTLSGLTEICEGEKAVLTLQDNYIAYLWDDNSNADTLAITATQLYSVTVTDDHGCTGATDLQVDVILTENPNVLGPQELCSGEIGVYTIEQNFSSYSWSNGSTSESITLEDAGLYSVMVTNAQGCTSESSFELIIKDAVLPAIEGSLEICEGESTVLSLSDVYETYLWEDNSQSPTIDATEAGTYAVTVTDDSGCTGTSAVRVSVITQGLTMIDSFTCNPSLVGVVEEYITSAGLCTDTLRYNIQLAEVSNCDIDYLFNIKNESCEDANNGRYGIHLVKGDIPVEVHLLNSAGLILQTDLIEELDAFTNYDFLAADNYTLAITTASGHQQEIAFTIVTEPFELMVTEEYNINLGDSITLQAEVDPTLLLSYNWLQNGNTLCSTNCTAVVVSPTESTTYTFDLTTIEGDCTLQASTLVRVKTSDNIYFPTIFNPSELNDNSEFKAYGPGATYLTELNIYDRWGSLVHSTEDNSGWSGRYNGSDLAAGVYVYVASFDNNEEQWVRQGHITLIK